jgi:hypothetical protein
LDLPLPPEPAGAFKADCASLPEDSDDVESPSDDSDSSVNFDRYYEAWQRRRKQLVSVLLYVTLLCVYHAFASIMKLVNFSFQLMWLPLTVDNITSKHLYAATAFVIEILIFLWMWVAILVIFLKSFVFHDVTGLKMFVQNCFSYWLKS